MSIKKTKRKKWRENCNLKQKTLSFQNTVSERMESCIKSLKIKNNGTI